MRTCADCGADISDRYKQSKRCVKCSNRKHQKDHKDRYGKNPLFAIKRCEAVLKFYRANKGKVHERQVLYRKYGTSKVCGIIKKTEAIAHLFRRNILSAETIKFIESGETYRAYE
jgi:hypothetical protein